MLKRACIFLAAAQLIGSSVESRDAHVVFRDTPEHNDNLKLRLWMWQHWSDRRVGIATVKWITMEGDSGTTDYAVANDRDGVLYLSIHLQGSDRFAESDAASWRDGWTIAHRVQRVEEPYHDDWPGKPILHSRPLPARKFVLELKDKEGKILTHI